MFKIRLSYKQKIFLYFLVIFMVFAVAVVLIEQRRAVNYKTEALEAKLDAYAEMIHSSIAHTHSNAAPWSGVDSLLSVLPPSVRLTIIDEQGQVLFDNYFKDLSALDSHASRPEIKTAQLKGTGSHVRNSASNGMEYLYYAKHYNNYFVRMALPYDVQVKRFLKPDNLFLYTIVLLFAVVLWLINYAAGRFAQSIAQLRDFAVALQKGETDVEPPHFPDDELGEIGTQIVANYRQMKETKKRVVQEREKLLQHVHSSGEGLCFFTAGRQAEYSNSLFIQHLNVLLDKPSFDPCVIFSDPLFADLHRFLEQHHPSEREYSLEISRQGKHMVVQANIFDDNSFEISIRDQTKRVKTKLLKQQMTSNIAHELRTPVTSIRGYLETVLEQPLTPDKQHQFISSAYKQVLALSELIQDMGFITKIEEVPETFDMLPIKLLPLLKDIEEYFAQQLANLHMQLELVNIDTMVVQGNGLLLHSIFSNLLQNAIHYAGTHTTVTIACYNQDNEYYYLSFADNGRGIADPAHLTRIFERFYRIGEGRTRDTGGSGLGLSIVKNAVKLHSSTIVAKNRVEGGLEFLFRLPKAH